MNKRKAPRVEDGRKSSKKRKKDELWIYYFEPLPAFFDYDGKCTLEGGGRVMAGGHWKEETSHDHENRQAHHMKDSRDDYLLRYQNEGLRQLHPVDNDDSAKLKSLHQHRNDDAMEDTLRQCELPPVEGETKLCATSLESMLDFTRAIFGIGTNFKVLTTNHHRKSTTPSLINSHLHNYTILNISREISATKMVACHTMPYPYTIFYCHHQESQSKVYKVSLMGEYDERVEAVVVCHMDTSAWDPGHVSFVMLGIKPGTDPVCHFFPEDHLVWVPSV
ncbi:hypothetical protein IFM89_016233 [Coptis chinensis]|uniref:BURP domain-containing protein n=1 Tax=Coptis chinensis TaxID=261450 RepID=A0A835I5A8_9MAGN|nr:hypothetical protein IFM89_016233 [Coptis chinensis]